MLWIQERKTFFSDLCSCFRQALEAVQGAQKSRVASGFFAWRAAVGRCLLAWRLPFHAFHEEVDAAQKGVIGHLAFG